MVDYLFLKFKKIVPQKWGWILEHGGFKRYFKNTGWMFMGQVVNTIVAFFVGAYMARYLGPSNFGLLSFVVGFVGLFSFLVGFGIDGVLNRELVKFPDKKEQLIGNGFWIKLFGAFLAFSVVNCFAYFLRNDSFTRMLIFLFSFTFLFQPFGVIGIFFQSQVLAKKNVIVQIIVALMTSFLKVVFILLKLDIVWFVGVFVVDVFFNTVVFLIMYYYNNFHIVWKIDWGLIKVLFRDSWPLMFITVATMIYMKIDQTMLKYMLDNEAVGIYSVAVRLSEFWYFLPNMICASVFPAIINAKRRGDDFYKKRLVALYRLMIFLAIGIAIPAVFLAKFIVLFLFGEVYLGATVPLQIYVCAGLPVFLMTAVAQYLVVENYTKIFFVATLLGAVANIVINIFFIPKYGIVGASFATLISYFVPLLVVSFSLPIRKQLVSIVFNDYEKI
jgi:O-antigen/teichoic acid export membrane protein